jgi:hypothetical protein
MKVNMLMADYAEAVNGKLYISGGGLSAVAPGQPFGIALDVKCPWEQANKPHKVRWDLIDSEGHPILLPGPPDGREQPVAFEPPDWELGRPAGVTPGTPLGLVMAVNVPTGLPLELGARCEWRLAIDAHTEEDWSLVFTVVPPQGQVMAA